ncbi:MAG: hypothetical protein V3V78_02115 [Candidatus Woesearchaeota archaeon]
MAERDIAKDIGAAAYGFLVSFLKENKPSAKKFLVKHKVGFLPEGFDYSLYHKLNKSALIKQLKFLIGKNHKTLPIILVGLYLRSLDQEERERCISDNREAIYKKYKEEGLDILKWTITGFLDFFIKWLSAQSVDKNLSKEEIINIYEKALSEWRELSIFVKREHTENYISHLCKTKIGGSKQVFFMFASGSAIRLADEVYKKLKKENLLTEYDVNLGHINQSLRESLVLPKKRISRLKKQLLKFQNLHCL